MPVYAALQPFYVCLVRFLCHTHSRATLGGSVRLIGTPGGGEGSSLDGGFSKGLCERMQNVFIFLQLSLVLPLLSLSSFVFYMSYTYG